MNPEALMHLQSDLVHAMGFCKGHKILPVGMSTSFHCQSKTSRYSGAKHRPPSWGFCSGQSPGQPEKQLI